MGLQRLTPGELAWLLTQLGRPTTAEMIGDCVDDGAPRNPDGTIDFPAFVAWLLHEIDRRADG